MKTWRYLSTTFNTEEFKIESEWKEVDEVHLYKVVYPEWLMKFAEPDSESSFERFLEVWILAHKALETESGDITFGGVNGDDENIEDITEY